MKVLKTLTVGVSLLALPIIASAQANPGGGVFPRGRAEPASVLSHAISAGAQAAATPGFGALKSLVGEWEGKTRTGSSVHVSYRLTSGGSALVETLTPAGEPEMTTVYSPDGNRVVVTHYCSANNQPRMRTASMTKPAKEYVFAFVSAANLSAPDAAHMQKLVIRLEDDDHFSQRWTWREKGKDATEEFRYTRVK